MKNKKLPKHKILSAFEFIIRFVLGCMFLISALPKIQQPYDFLGDIYKYEIIGPKLGILVAMMVPWTELLLGICLLGSIFVSGALLTSAAMGAAFTFFISWAIYHNLDISCGCFGPSNKLIDYWTLVRAILITLFSFLAYLYLLLNPVKGRN